MSAKILSITERPKNFPKTDFLTRYLIVLHILFGALQNRETVAAKETKPIETKIKEFVILIRWNDINSEKIKDQVEKSNRKLYGFKKSTMTF
ncbi:hypothetical protein EIN_000360 [Entamoeba invadens IP1]|uniref:Uncharacterized protein n=1 Tax=Entamoeba invadens IP1 TaxID=370355 RepID=L7FJP1_ENTIV|nr:hypothetical protein EIN_000360 [Entamoeba invadens IP1]ELP83603.1 hypothetical protein EIN_000360 [Entamoeba invadens IP1]|eukprot:XP_004182949.1 hypothetical protein EIN_000360 [Entamoeba invadens IP1]